MSDIAEEYIRIALSKANGNKALARKALIEAAAKDAHLAQVLAAPYFEAIITQAIDRYLRLGGLEVAPVTTQEEKSADKKEAPPTEASNKHKAAVLQMVAAFKKRD